jgi:hypothetical protein
MNFLFRENLERSKMKASVKKTYAKKSTCTPPTILVNNSLVNIERVNPIIKIFRQVELL